MNYDEIRKVFDVMDLGLTEVRIIDEKGYITSGYFNDVEVLIENLKRYENKKGLNFYFTLNSVNDACYSRQQRDCFTEKPKVTTSDKDITQRDWLLIDLDCERPTGVSSNDVEIEQAKTKANEIYRYMKRMGFERPVITESGNGVHLLYKINLDNSDSSTKLIKDCLLALDMMFSDSVKVDTAVFNASRITKLYGTKASKGRDTKDRPHRISKIVMVPDEVKVNDMQLLINLTKTLPAPPKRTFNQVEFDIDDWLSRNGVRIKQELSFSGGRKLILEECPFDSNHKGKDSAIFVLNNGAIGFKCFHASCSDRTWQDVRLLYEPTAYSKRIEPRINSTKPKPKREEPKNEPVFYTAQTIKGKDRSQVISIPTGIKGLDKKIIGLNKGEVSCISGLRGSGKSSVILQICLETVQLKYKVALFSGELSENRVLEWMQLQAAGKQYTTPTKYENYFYVKDEHKKRINEWLNDRLFIYNNRYGNDATKIINSVSECITKNKVDLVILDNLMSMSLETFSGDKWERQTGLILKLMEFAKEYDVHILFVAHPRKSMGFLRTDDISGSGDLTNAVDNVFIIHRVNTDFRKKGNELFGWHQDDEIFDYTNVIEVCKNRDLGVQDLFVGLQYEIESKRFLNERYEPKHYDWEEQGGFYEIMPWEDDE